MSPFLKNLALLAGISFTLNLIWENLHYVLYLHYKGGPITEWVLLHATLVDAFIITAVVALCMLVPWLQSRDWIMVVVWVGIAVGIELWALGTARWAYGEAMPLVPLLGVGLSPTVQLAITGYTSYFLVYKHMRYG